jgi:hypothetical protein
MNSRIHTVSNMMNKENEQGKMQEELAMAYFKPESQHELTKKPRKSQ